MNDTNDILNLEEKIAFLQSIENVQRTAVTQLRKHGGETSVVAFVQRLQHGIDSVVCAAIDAGTRIDCKAGCNYCCSARVEAIAPEIFRIAHALEQRPADDLVDVVGRLHAHIATHDKENTAWNRRTSCPFLEQNLCSIYEVRPAACRKAHSIDVNKCAASAPVIPQNLGIVLNAEALQSGTSGAYRQCGFDASTHELVSAVLVALLDPSVPARWYRGEQVFGAAAPKASNTHAAEGHTAD